MQNTGRRRGARRHSCRLGLAAGKAVIRERTEWCGGPACPRWPADGTGSQPPSTDRRPSPPDSPVCPHPLRRDGGGGDPGHYRLINIRGNIEWVDWRCYCYMLGGGGGLAGYRRCYLLSSGRRFPGSQRKHSREVLVAYRPLPSLPSSVGPGDCQ